MANTFNFGNGNWAQKTEKVLAYNAENNNYKPLPFDFDRASTATRVNKDGLIETVGVDEPRIDFLNNTKGHLLLEPSRQNVVDNSTNFFLNSWNGTRVSEGSTIISPNGNDEAHKLIATSVNNTHYRVYTYSSAPAGSYTASVFFKKDEYEVGVVRIDADGAANRIGVAINISNGTFISQNTTGTPTGTSYKIEDYGSGWYRLSVTINHTSGSVRINISTAPLNFTWSNGLPVFLGNSSDGGYAWGAQLEAGSYATSYIPTQGETNGVTRSAESCYQQNDYVLSNTSGTIFFELGNYNTNTSASGFNKILAFQEVSSSSLDNLIYFEEYNGENTILVRKGGSTLLQSTPGYQDLRDSKIAIKFSNTEAKIFIDGVLNNTYSGDASLSLEYFGFDNPYNGQIVSTIKLKDLKLYNTALTDAELIALTS